MVCDVHQLTHPQVLPEEASALNIIIDSINGSIPVIVLLVYHLSDCLMHV